jgi:hypothetical protein
MRYDDKKALLASIDDSASIVRIHDAIKLCENAHAWRCLCDLWEDSPTNERLYITLLLVAAHSRNAFNSGVNLALSTITEGVTI